MQILFKCRKCRKVLFSEKEACNSHGEYLSSDETKLEMCSSPDVYYLKEETFPLWMKDQVAEGNWMKGKLFCPVCNYRIGSFNFVCGSKCHCGLCVLPPLHVVSHKLDREIKTLSHVPESYLEIENQSS
ncbi:uncharacterized protein TNIN_238971 [Trichonephila inaurata madagascariensis]|uniref:E3 ubiquitin-protein ligase RNF180 n=1 Tax=Trichonephila inaurata madagascariensis TaxID=2747483 RepID=A0A8X6X8T6_9ARAC|nr:uncharacterized protein TNIN_238971 [Trichonephila inaurata madagascariensis]